MSRIDVEWTPIGSTGFAHLSIVYRLDGQANGQGQVIQGGPEPWPDLLEYLHAFAPQALDQTNRVYAVNDTEADRGGGNSEFTTDADSVWADMASYAADIDAEGFVYELLNGASGSPYTVNSNSVVVSLLSAAGKEYDDSSGGTVDRTGIPSGGTPGDHTFISGSMGSSLIGTASSDFFLSRGGSVTLIGGGGDDTMFAGEDDDILIGGAGDDFLHGGESTNPVYNGMSGNTLKSEAGLLRGGQKDTAIQDDGFDTANYQSSPEGIKLGFGANYHSLQVNDGWGGTDYLVSIEHILAPTAQVNIADGSGFGQSAPLSFAIIDPDTALIKGAVNDISTYVADINSPDYNTAVVRVDNFYNFIGTSSGDGDSINFSALLGGVNIEFGSSITSANGSSGPDKYVLSSIETVIGTNYADKLSGEFHGYVSGNHQQLINTGSGVDTIEIKGTLTAALTVNTGAGADIIKSLPNGTVVYTGADADRVEVGNNIYILDATAEDRITWQGSTLSGGVHYSSSEGIWAYGQHAIGYTLNLLGEMVIRSVLKNANGSDRLTFIANYTNDEGGPDRTMGLLATEIKLEAYRLLEGAPDWAAKSGISLFEAYMGWVSKAMTGQSFYKGVDPLVIDLDGDGIELLARSSIAPSFDIDNDQFAEQTGWVGKDDGILVRDLNGNGKIDNIGEMFGSESQSGFAALAQLDSNGDGVINASDAAFTNLRVWRDTDGDGQTDAGELLTLSSAGVAAINTPDLCAYN